MKKFIQIYVILITMNVHDGNYKNLFSHAEMVEDLLRGFVHEDWVDGLDFSTLEKVNAGYVSDDLRDRADDIIWKVRWGKDNWLYVYILLEFQSGVYKFMAVRILSYVGLLYQDLIKSKQLTAGGKLPPVLPMKCFIMARTDAGTLPGTSANLSPPCPASWRDWKNTCQI